MFLKTFFSSIFVLLFCFVAKAEEWSEWHTQSVQLTNFKIVGLGGNTLLSGEFVPVEEASQIEHLYSGQGYDPISTVFHDPSANQFAYIAQSHLYQGRPFLVIGHNSYIIESVEEDVVRLSYYYDPYILKSTQGGSLFDGLETNGF